MQDYYYLFYLSIYSRLWNLNLNLILYGDLFIDMVVPDYLGAKLIMNRNDLFFPMCTSMTLRRPQKSLDSR